MLSTSTTSSNQRKDSTVDSSDVNIRISYFFNIFQFCIFRGIKSLQIKTCLDSFDRYPLPRNRYLSAVVVHSCYRRSSHLAKSLARTVLRSHSTSFSNALNSCFVCSVHVAGNYVSWKFSTAMALLVCISDLL